ncbi:MAG TPA: hypothetical protein PK959_06495 [Candidatus Competibacteraceae bacterium]|nr:hypothetical protein [Candidatus Competibacteraceae bacterium]
MKKKRVKALALEWMRRSRDDDETARQPLAKDIQGTLKMMARTRRNCAWELLRMLNDAEKANPSEEGLPRPRADGESA